MSDDRNPQIFLAKLPRDVTERDLEKEFRIFGSIKDLQLKRGYAFIEFYNYRDAQDAIKEKDGSRLNGKRIVVQNAFNRKHRRSRSISTSRSIEKPKRNYYHEYRGPTKDDMCYNCGKTGHWANECRDPFKPRNNSFRDLIKCYACGERGHIGKECPMKDNEINLKRRKSYSSERRSRRSNGHKYKDNERRNKHSSRYSRKKSRSRENSKYNDRSSYFSSCSSSRSSSSSRSRSSDSSYKKRSRKHNDVKNEREKREEYNKRNNLNHNEQKRQSSHENTYDIM